MTAQPGSDPQVYPRSARTTANRERDRISYSREVANTILDEALYCHLGFTVTNSGGVAEPRVLPTLHVRVDDTLYLHGSTGSRPLLAAAQHDGLAVCVAVTLLDGLVLARSQFNHSANYRSVVAHGTARPVTGERDKLAALTALVDKIASGRAVDTRAPTARELAQTSVLALPLTEVSVKIRSGPVADDPPDLALPHWAGVVPLRLKPGRPEPDAGVAVAVPDYLRADRGPWFHAPQLHGTHVRLEPLDMSHVERLFAAVADEQVYRYLPVACPASAAEMATIVARALDDPTRVAFVQRHAGTGEVVGQTSYYEIDPVNRSLAIGHTALGRAWWRTGINTEAKLLLMRRAFDELGCVRVVWHTDLRNIRSQESIERLGAHREAVLRRHKRLADGTWRDTVQYAMTDQEWPGAHARLVESLDRTRAPGEA